jgi:hypothetical protein
MPVSPWHDPFSFVGKPAQPVVGLQLGVLHSPANPVQFSSQLRQWLGVPRGVSQPVAGSLSQLPQLAAQVTVHVPALQA